MSEFFKLGSEYTFVFGKRKPFENGVVREFEKLHVGANLSRESLDLLNELCKSFRWCGVGPDIWSPVPATVALNNPQRLLVCRILDDGSDNINRPHLVRVEAVEVNLEQSVGMDSVGPYLDPEAWSVEGPEFHAIKIAKTKPAHSDTNWKLSIKVGTWSIGGDPTSFVFKTAVKEYKPTSGWSIPKPKDLQKEQFQSNLKNEQIGIEPFSESQYNGIKTVKTMNIIKIILKIALIIAIAVLDLIFFWISMSIKKNVDDTGVFIKKINNDLPSIRENIKNLNDVLPSIKEELKIINTNLQIINSELQKIKGGLEKMNNKNDSNKSGQENLDKKDDKDYKKLNQQKKQFK